MSFKLFDYCSLQGKNEFKVWAQKLQSAERGKLRSKLDMLEQNGDGLFPELLSATNTPGILKLRIKGKVQLRPMLCRGPVSVGQEYTLLLGAIEVGGELDPVLADAIAMQHKEAVLAAPTTRRIDHERVG